MLRNVCVLVLLTGAAALQRPGYGEMMRMTLKSRSASEVSLDMEAEEQIMSGGADLPSATTQDEMGQAKGSFAGFVIMTAGCAFGTYYFTKTRGAASEEAQGTERGLSFYNKLAPSMMVFMAFMMFCSVVGGVVSLNNKVDDAMPQTDYPDFIGKQVMHDRINNPGERAFFAAFGLVTQAVLGFLVCLYLRKSQEVQLSTSMIMKMGLRGAAAGILATGVVEFLRLPFHNYMSGEEVVAGRIFVVLIWVAAVALMEEVLKISSVALGLKSGEQDQESLPAMAESAQALAICGLAVGMGFAFIENIPRFYAVALTRPVVYFAGQSENGGQQWGEIIGEGTLRSGRTWTFVFWGLMNLQPWLTGLAAMQLANLKAPIAPMDWVSVLKFVVILHCVFDLLDRSANALVEFVGCCVIPYAMYTFYKQWKSMGAAAPAGSLLTNQE